MKLYVLAIAALAAAFFLAACESTPVPVADSPSAPTVLVAVKGEI